VGGRRGVTVREPRSEQSANNCGRLRGECTCEICVLLVGAEDVWSGGKRKLHSGRRHVCCCCHCGYLYAAMAFGDVNQSSISQYQLRDTCWKVIFSKKQRYDWSAEVDLAAQLAAWATVSDISKTGQCWRKIACPSIFIRTHLSRSFYPKLYC
jgi:hypothetical protein